MGCKLSTAQTRSPLLDVDTHEVSGAHGGLEYHARRPKLNKFDLHNYRDSLQLNRNNVSNAHQNADADADVDEHKNARHNHKGLGLGTVERSKNQANTNDPIKQTVFPDRGKHATHGDEFTNFKAENPIQEAAELQQSNDDGVTIVTTIPMSGDDDDDSNNGINGHHQPETHPEPSPSHVGAGVTTNPTTNDATNAKAIAGNQGETSSSSSRSSSSSSSSSEVDGQNYHRQAEYVGDSSDNVDNMPNNPQVTFADTLDPQKHRATDHPKERNDPHKQHKQPQKRHQDSENSKSTASGQSDNSRDRVSTNVNRIHQKSNRSSSRNGSLTGENGYLRTGRIPFLGHRIVYNDIRFGGSLGSGTYGEVFKARVMGYEVALKRIFMGSTQEERDEILTDYRKEVEILSRLEHPNIVRFLGTGARRMNPEGVPKEFNRDDGERRCLVFEMCEGSVASLLKLVRKKRCQVTWRICLTIAKDAAEAVEYLHSLSPPILHRDLKAENLLLTSDFRCKLTDFGLSRPFTDPTAASLMTVCGTPCWVAPEVFRNEAYDEKVDVYSFGIVLWELFSGKKPHADRDCNELPYLVGKKGLRPPTLQHCPPALNQLMQDCWTENAQDRPSFSEIVTRLKKIESELQSCNRMFCAAHRTDVPWKPVDAMPRKRSLTQPWERRPSINALRRLSPSKLHTEHAPTPPPPPPQPRRRRSKQHQENVESNVQRQSSNNDDRKQKQQQQQNSHDATDECSSSVALEII